MAGFSPAYFISPKGKIVYVGTNHIAYIIRNPEKFWLSIEFIEYVYNHYNERLGMEGKAREQIILSLIDSGWIRIRRYGDRFWSVDDMLVAEPILMDRIKDRIFNMKQTPKWSRPRVCPDWVLELEEL